jgi:acetyl esterase/lipase
VDKISCRPDFAIPVYSGYLKAKDKDELASSLRIPPETPPIFLVHGGDDIISPPENSVLMYLALKRAGIPLSCTSMRGLPTISVSAPTIVHTPSGRSLVPTGCARVGCCARIETAGAINQFPTRSIQS